MEIQLKITPTEYNHNDIASRFDCIVSGRDCWNKCIYCGRFIAYDDFVNGKAENIMTLPESLVTNETWETYHIECKSR